ncbi:MAG TPA: Calx-beta domain-containing protein, partial [Tepidisphaeraceae bacterium]|nr:Calx-beta domain-containing protein [Tepidisphaeraceae bacterium]
LDIRTFTNQEGDADTFLRVFDASGNQLAANDNIDNSTTASAVRLRVQAGQTYFVAVSGANPAAAQYDPVTGSGTSSGSTGNYSLSATVAANSFTVSTPPETIEPFQAPDQIIFTIAIDDPLSQKVSVDYATVDGTAVAGTDYTAVSGTVTFGPGQTSQTVAVEILPNAGTSAAKTFTLDLSNSQGAPIAIGQGVATIQDVSYTQVAFGSGKVASYRDNNGQRISLSLFGAGSGRAVFIGTSREPTEINVTGAANSILNIKGSRTTVGDITVNGSLSALNARGVNVSGNVDITGPAGKISLGNIGSTATQQTLTLGGGNSSVTLGHVVDLILTTPGALTLLSVLGWNQSGVIGNSISATSIGSLKSRGSFNSNLTTGGLGTASISGGLSGGIWTVSGGGGAISATGAAAGGWSATFTGSIGVLQLGSDSASISAASIRLAKIKGVMSGATLNITSAQGTDLGSLSIGGAVGSSQIRAAGSIGAVTAGSLSGSLLFAGVADSVTALPDATIDFISPASISRLTVRGSFSASDVAAISLGKIVIHSIAPGNGGAPFGLATKSLSSIQSPPDKWTSRLSPTLLKPDGDFIVRLLS